MGRPLVEHTFYAVMDDGAVLHTSVVRPEGEPAPIVTDNAGHTWVYTGSAPVEEAGAEEGGAG